MDKALQNGLCNMKRAVSRMGDMIATVLDPAFSEAMLTAAADHETKARLTIALLKEISLAGSAKTKSSDFLIENAGGQTIVKVELDRYSNLIGMFCLPSDSPLLSQVVAAIEASLAGPLFKAALRTRRVDKLIRRKQEAMRRAGWAAYQKEFKAITANGWRQLTSEEEDRCQKAYDAARDPLEARMNARVLPIYQAPHPGFRGDYLACWARFFARNLLPTPVTPA